MPPRKPPPRTPRRKPHRAPKRKPSKAEARRRRRPKPRARPTRTTLRRLPPLPAPPTVPPTLVADLERALAEERARAERRTAELERLNEVGRKLALVLDQQELYRTIYDEMGRLMDTRNMFICLYDEAKQRLYFPFYFEDGQPVPPKERPLSHGLTDHVIRTRAALLIAKDYEATTEALAIEPFGPPTKAWMGVPMIAEGRVLGVIAIWNREREGAYDEDLMKLVQTFANQAAIAVRNAQLYDELHEREETYRAVVETAARAGEGVAIVRTGAGNRTSLAYVNEEFVRLTGYHREELLRLGLEDLVLPDQLPKVLGVERRRPGAQGPRHESTLVAKDGTLVPIEVSAGQGSLDGELATVCFVRDISERKRAEREVLELKNFNVDIVETAPVGIAYLDQHAHITYENPAMLSIMGVAGPTSPALHMNLFEHPSIRGNADLRARLEGLLRGEPFSETTFPFTALTGKEVEIAASGVPIIREGVVAGAMLLVRDVTAARRFERELLEQRNFNQSIVENAPIGIVYLDAQGTVTYENPHMLRAMGWRPGQALLGQGERVAELPSIRAKPEFAARIASLLRGQAFRDLTLPYRSLYGRDLVANISGVPIERGGQSAGAMLLVEDVTEKVALEQRLKEYTENLEQTVAERTAALRAANRELEEAKRSLETILASTADGIASLDPHGHLLFHNTTFADLAGVPDLAGRDLLEVLRSADEGTAAALRSAHAALLRGEALRPLEVDLRNAAGEAVHGVLTALPIVEEGRVASVVVTLTDITDRKRLEDELRRYTKDLEREVERRSARLIQSAKMAALGQLVAGVAHEINNPLAFVKSNTENLLEACRDLRDGPLGKAVEAGGIASEEELLPLLQSEDLRFVLLDTSRLLEDNLKGLERIAQIVSQLRNFASPQMGRMQYGDLNAVLRDTVQLWMPQFKDRLAIHQDYDLSLPKVRLDSGQFTQVVMNLLVNAGQAVKAKGNVWVATRRRGGWAEVEVRDDGPGIPSEVLPRIWDPFFTTKEKGNTGLGLSISYQIVKEHGGEISVDTELGKGTSFTVRLPLQEGA